jgi:hypothetical protein
VPWAYGNPQNAVAYLFASQLVANGQRPDGSANKILWVAQNGTDFVIQGHPLGSLSPVVTVSSQDGPSLVDVPSPGCWSFQLTWSVPASGSSTFDLSVLPAGSTPTS